MQVAAAAAADARAEVYFVFIKRALLHERGDLHRLDQRQRQVGVRGIQTRRRAVPRGLACRHGDGPQANGRAADVQAQALVINGEEIADTKLMAAARAEGRINLYGTYPSETIGPVLEAFKKEFDLKESKGGEGLEIVASDDDDTPFVGVVIEKKEHIFPALEAFLKRDRWQK